jgi:uncharacterized phage-associated protein
MDFVFQINKAVAASSLLAKEAGGTMDIAHLLKALYLSDRKALLKWERPITGDRFYSMNHGPIVSRVYDLVRSKVSGSDMERWEEFFSARVGNQVTLTKEPNLDALSDREIAVLLETWNEIKNLSFRELKEYTHKLPEYVEVKGTSVMIDPAKIFSEEGFLEDDIAKIDCEISFAQQARLSLS